MANLKYISRFIIFRRTRGVKWIFLAKKKQLSFYECLRHIAASIKEGLLHITMVDHCARLNRYHMRPYPTLASIVRIISKANCKMGIGPKTDSNFSTSKCFKSLKRFTFRDYRGR